MLQKKIMFGRNELKVGKQAFKPNPLVFTTMSIEISIDAAKVDARQEIP